MKRVLSVISDGLCSSFISRNNDVDGYWGIGKIYGFMESLDIYEVRIDLLNRTIEPSEDCFPEMINHYSDKLSEYLRKRSMQKETLIAAYIVIHGIPNKSGLKHGGIAPHRVICSTVLVDSNLNRYNSINETRCRAHNPALEMRSERV